METKLTTSQPMDLTALAAEINAIRAYASRHMKARARNATRSKGRKERHLNEPQVAMVMVQPVLNLMGWGTRDDPDSLWRELALPNGQADFACLVENEVKVTIECKNAGINLREEKVVTQACCYAFAAGAPFAVLTDGVIWAIYSTFAKGRPMEKLVRKIDLIKCSIEDAAEFFGFWCKARATSGELRIAKPQTAARKARGRKSKSRRASLKSPQFRNHIALVERSVGGPLRPVENARNTFETSTGERIRFCLSSGKKGAAMFNIGREHLDGGLLFLAHEGCEHGWLVPADMIGEYLLGTSVTDGGVRKNWTPRVTWSEEGDVLWTNREALKTLSLTAHRHPVGHA
ncbi:hypothetical protein HFN89_05945 [Rhizobium laguerreae]|nr:hypothetical protein [Rhizobium laguerreae]